MIDYHIENLTVDDFIEILNTRKFEGGVREFDKFVKKFFENYDASMRIEIERELTIKRKAEEAEKKKDRKSMFNEICYLLDEIVLENSIAMKKIEYKNNHLNKKKQHAENS